MDPARDCHYLRRGARRAFSMLVLCAAWQLRAESPPQATVDAANLRLACDELHFGDPSHQSGNATGHVTMTVTTDGDSSTVYQGKADTVEFDTAKKKMVLHGHPEVTKSGGRHVGTSDDTDMVIDWSVPTGFLTIDGPQRTEVLQGVVETEGASVEKDCFTVFGQVKWQGAYEIAADEKVRISQAISRAGGGTKFAVLKKVHVVRRTGDGRNVTINVNVDDVVKNGNADKDIFILPHDVIIVDEGYSLRNFCSHDSVTPDGSGPMRPYHPVPPEPNIAIYPTIDMEELDDTTRMRVGDLVSFRIVEDHGRALSLRVQEAGELQTPHLGPVKAAGLTCKKVAYEIRRHLEKKGYAKATVIIGMEYRGDPKPVVDFAPPSLYLHIIGHVDRQEMDELAADEHIFEPLIDAH